jgi:hypothetical protein
MTVKSQDMRLRCCNPAARLTSLPALQPYANPETLSANQP